VVEVGGVEVVVARRLSDLAPTLTVALEVLGELGDSGAHLVLLDDGVDTTVLGASAVGCIARALAELRRSSHRAAKMAGVQAALERGADWRAPTGLDPEVVLEAAKTHPTVAGAARALGVSRRTFRRRLAEARPPDGDAG